MIELEFRDDPTGRDLSADCRRPKAPVGNDDEVSGVP